MNESREYPTSQKCLQLFSIIMSVYKGVVLVHAVILKEKNSSNNNTTGN